MAKHSEVNKARDLLDKLQARTEARGATPAEALQAAKLAERIAKRHGLDLNAERTFESIYTTSQKTFPKWKCILSWAIRDRFGVTAEYGMGKGQSAAIRFSGPEHLASVAAWLFRAIETDIDKRSYIAARALGLKGGKLRSFRLEFSRGAAREVWSRLNPRPEPAPEPKPMSAEELDRLRKESEDWDAKERKRLSKLTPTQLQKEINARLARMKGIDFGKEIPIDTNVVAGCQAKKIEQQSSGAKAEGSQ